MMLADQQWYRLMHDNDIGPLSTAATKYLRWMLICKNIQSENFPTNFPWTFCNVDEFSLGPVFKDPFFTIFGLTKLNNLSKILWNIMHVVSSYVAKPLNCYYFFFNKAVNNGIYLIDEKVVILFVISMWPTIWNCW